MAIARSHKMKIKFINFPWKSDDANDKTLGLSPIYYFLKSFYLKNGQFNPDWLPTENDPNELNFEILKKESPDVFCFSMYCWNKHTIDELAIKLKELFPNSIFVVGGPEINHKEDMFSIFPWMDYAVYGDGERAFQLLIDALHTNDFSDCVNLITREKIYKHEIFRFKDYEEFSPYLDLRDEYKNEVLNLADKHGLENIRLNYQRVRGCPFKCAFCNWQSGLHWKVNVRESDWREEMDFFAEIDGIVRIIDANFGIYDEDVDMIEYAMKLYREKDSNFIFIPGSISKVKKKNVFEIYSIILDNLSIDDRKHPLKFHLQDIHSDILENINRPEIPWEEQKEFIAGMKKLYPYANFEPELVMGLPGFTSEKYKYQMLEFASIPMGYTIVNQWEFLVNSLAAEKSYQEKYNLVLLQTDESHRAIYVMEKDKWEDIIKARIYNEIYNRCVIRFIDKINRGIPFDSFLRYIYSNFENEIAEFASILFNKSYVDEKNIKTKFLYQEIDTFLDDIFIENNIKQLIHAHPRRIATWLYKRDLS
jgi:hypothetical protein